MTGKPCNHSPQNGVLVNPDRFLPFSAFPNMYIVSFFQKNEASRLAPQGFSMSTSKSVNPQRSYAGLRGLRRVVLFHMNLLYMTPLFFASWNLPPGNRSLQIKNTARRSLRGKSEREYALFRSSSGASSLVTPSLFLKAEGTGGEFADFIADVFTGERRRKRRPGAISAPCGAPTEPQASRPSVRPLARLLRAFALRRGVWLHTLGAPFRLHAAARLGPRCFRRDCAAAFRLHSAARVFHRATAFYRPPFHCGRQKAKKQGNAPILL